jgi:hypothetical protein
MQITDKSKIINYRRLLSPDSDLGRMEEGGVFVKRNCENMQCTTQAYSNRNETFIASRQRIAYAKRLNLPNLCEDRQEFPEEPASRQ